MEFNTRNINAAAKAETISTSRKINQAIAAFRERRYLAKQRYLALEERFRTLSKSDVCYASANGFAIPMPLD